MTRPLDRAVARLDRRLSRLWVEVAQLQAALSADCWLEKHA